MVQRAARCSKFAVRRGKTAACANYPFSRSLHIILLRALMLLQALCFPPLRCHDCVWPSLTDHDNGLGGINKLGVVSLCNEHEPCLPRSDQRTVEWPASSYTPLCVCVCVACKLATLLKLYVLPAQKLATIGSSGLYIYIYMYTFL